MYPDFLWYLLFIMSGQSLKEKTAKSLLWGGLSNSIQQLLNLFFGIFLARTLSRADYGMVGMLSIFSLIASSLQESGFTAALTNKKEIRHEDYNAVFWFSVGMGTTLYIVLSCCAPLIAAFYNTPELTSLARYSFLGFFISSLGVAQSAYMFRNLLVKQRSIAMMSALAISGTVGVLLAVNGFSYWGIATQNIVYVSVLTILYWFYSPWRPSFHFDFRPIKSMLSFSSRLLITNIFGHINYNILSVVLGKYYSGQAVGDFNQANKWNYMGYSVIVGMINGVAQPVLVNVSDDTERQKRVFRKMLQLHSLYQFPVHVRVISDCPGTDYNRHYLKMVGKCKYPANTLHRQCIYQHNKSLLQSDNQQRQITAVHVEYDCPRNHSGYKYVLLPSLRHYVYDKMLCNHQCLLATGMAIFCLERNRSKPLSGSAGYPPLCLYCWNHNVGYRIHYPFIRIKLIRNLPLTNLAGSTYLHDYYVAQRFSYI